MGLALPIVNSDHPPIVLIPNPPVRWARYFKYEAFWEEHDQCRQTVSDGWVSDNQEENEWDSLKSKFKNCKKALMSWHNSTFKNAAVEISKLKVKLQVLLNAGSNSTDWEAVRLIRKEIDSLWKQEEMYWGQRFRLKWLKYGDKNSKKFHITTV